MSSLTLRISLILSGALLLVVMVLALAMAYHQSQDSRAAPRFPMPEQAASMIELIESTPSDQLPLVLRALNSDSVSVRVNSLKPLRQNDETTLPGVSLFLRSYLDRLDGRIVEAMMGHRSSTDTLSPNERPLRLVAGLRDGRFVIIDVRGGVLRYLIGFRLLSATCFMLLLIGGVSLWLLRRQIEPLEEVVKAVEYFGENIKSPALSETGASEVKKLVQAFNQMQGRIRALLEGRTRMMAAISHDLGTYLTRLRLRSEYIVNVDQRIRAISDIEAMESLMNDTLAIGRLERSELLHEMVDLHDLVIRQVQDYSTAGQRVRLMAAEPALVEANVNALTRVISNLIDNALKYAGAAEVSLVRSVGNEIHLLVEDCGPGIPFEQRALVLEPFYRCDEARNMNTPGFGMGLSIVSEIILRYKGKLSFEGRPEGGLRVKVAFKLAAHS